MEKINCLPEVNWRPVYLKNYTLVNIIITTLSMLIETNKWNLLLYSLFRVPLHLFLIYVVYTYTRDLGNKFSTSACSELKATDKNIHEFLKFYTLLQVVLMFMTIVIVLSLLASVLPKYRSMLKLILVK